MTTDEGLTPEQFFGQLVKTAREGRDWTQEALARRVRELTGVTVDQSAIARIEAGKRTVRLNEVVALAEVLGVDLSAFGRAPTAEESNNRTAKLATERLMLVEQEIAATREHVRSMEVSLTQARARLHQLGEQRALLSQVLNTLLRGEEDAATARAQLKEILGEDSDGER